MEPLKFFPGNRIARHLYIGVILFTPLILLIPGWDGFPYNPRANFSDLVITHYPNALFTLDALRQGQFPLWSPMLFAGYPFAANPLSGLWYLPGWLALIFPLPLGFNLAVLVHLLFSGLGMCLFLHELKIGWVPALTGALTWELMPKIFAHIGAGHLTLIYAIAWTPWLLLAELKRGKSKFQYWSSVLLAMIVLADIRWAMNAGLLWLAFSAWQWFKNKPPNKWKTALKNWGTYFSISLGLTGLISAPLILPLAQYTSLSTRSLMSVEDNLSFSLSPARFLGLIAPDFGAYAEWSVYLGGMFLLITIWVLTHHQLRKGACFWLAVLACTLLWSSGAYFPLNQWFARLPGMDLLRVPSRFMIIFGFAGSVLTGYFLRSFPLNGERRDHFWGNLISAGMVMFAWVIMIGVWLTTGIPSPHFFWGAAILTVGFLLLLMGRRGNLPLIYFQVGIILVILLDLGGVARSNFRYVDKQLVMSENSSIPVMLEPQNEPFRAYSPSYSIPQQTAAINRLETISGIDPLQLKSFVQFFSQASGIPYQKYSVTIPPFKDAEISLGNQDYPINAPLMGWLNVKYIVSAFPIDSPGLQLQKVENGQHVYVNLAWKSRAWIQPSKEISNLESGPVFIRSYQANRIELEGTGPGYLVLSEVEYPGWEVYVDGEKMNIETIHQLFRGVNLQPGRHQVIFSYRPELLSYSLAGAILGWLFVIYQILISGSVLWHPQKKNGL